MLKALDLIIEYQSTEKACIKIIDKIPSGDLSKDTKTIHQIVIDYAFGSDKELSLDEIIKDITEKSPAAYFANNAYSLKQAYEKVNKAYKSYSTDLSISNVEIKYWCKGSVEEWSEKVKNNDLNPSQNELIAVVMQAAILHNGFAPRDTQILSLISLINKASKKGRLAQINTGEGKSLIVAMLAAIKALQGNEVDVVTTSVELSKPEVRKQRPFFEMLNLTVAENSDGNAKIYSKDIVYGTSSDFQGDILRSEFMKQGTRGKRGFGTVIIDEVDSMLYDGRTHSIRLSGSTPAMSHLEILLASIWNQVTQIANHTIIHDNKYLHIPEDFSVNGLNITLYSGKNPHQVGNIIEDLTGYIKEKTEKYAKNLIRDIYSERNAYNDYKKMLEDQSRVVNNIEKNINVSFCKEELKRLEGRIAQSSWCRYHDPYVEIPKHLCEYARMQIPYWVDSAINALFRHKKSVDYAVKDGRIIVIDRDNTGVLQQNMVWSNGLAQMLQLKEGLPLIPEGISTNSLSGSGYFKRYDKNSNRSRSSLNDLTWRLFLIDFDTYFLLSIEKSYL